MSARYPSFHYIDYRDLGTCRSEWLDDFRPENEVWPEVACRYSAKLREILGDSSANGCFGL